MRSRSASAGISPQPKVCFAASPSRWGSEVTSPPPPKFPSLTATRSRCIASLPTDPGTVVNPAQIERQIAGSFVFGLTGLFYGGCTVKDGRIEQTMFDTYISRGIREMPKVEAIGPPSGGFWGGVGEPTATVAAPAVLNAYFAA